MMRKPEPNTNSKAGGVLTALLTTVVVVVLFGFFGVGVYFLVRGISQDSAQTTIAKRPVVRSKQPIAKQQSTLPATAVRQPTPGITTRSGTTGSATTPSTSMPPSPAKQPGASSIPTAKALTSVEPATVRFPEPPLAMAPGIAIGTGDGEWFSQKIAEWIRGDLIQITEVNHQLVQRFEAMPPYYLDYDRIELTVHGSFPEIFEFLQVVETEIPLAVFRKLRITDTAELGTELSALIDLPRLLNPDRIPDRKQGEILRLAERIQHIRWVAPAPKNPFRPPHLAGVIHTEKVPTTLPPLTRELAKEHLILSGIIGKGEGGMAILNDKIYRVGETITVQVDGMPRQAKLLEILSPPARVKLQSSDESFFVFAVVE
jgi:hypothetical protein